MMVNDGTKNSSVQFGTTLTAQAFVKGHIQAIASAAAVVGPGAAAPAIHILLHGLVAAHDPADANHPLLPRLLLALGRVSIVDNEDRHPTGHAHSIPLTDSWPTNDSHRREKLQLHITVLLVVLHLALSSQLPIVSLVQS